MPRKKTPDIPPEKLEKLDYFIRLAGVEPEETFRKRKVKYLETAPQPVEKIIDLVEFFERVKRHKADAWQIDFCTKIQDAFLSRHEKTMRALVHAEAQLGKSVILAQCYPAWILGHDPMHRVALATYNVTRSKAHSRAVIGIMNLPVYKEIFKDPRSYVKPKISAERWQTAARSEGRTEAQDSFNPVGLQSGLTGSGFDCFPAETVVQTEIGNITIGELFMLKYTPRVYAYNHVAGQVELRQIQALRRMPADELIEITTNSGSVIRCTPNHRIWANGEYIEAGQCETGMRLSRLLGQKGQVQQEVSSVLGQGQTPDGETRLRALPGVLRGASLHREQAPEEWRQPDLLFCQVPGGMDVQNATKTGPPVRKVPADHESSIDVSAFLLEQMPPQTGQSILSRASVPDVRSGVSTPKLPNRVLRANVCQQGPFSENGRQRKLTLQDRHELREMVPGNEADHSRPRRTQMRGLRKTRDISRVSMARPDGSTEQARYSPHRPQSGEQRLREPGNAVRRMPSHAPHVTDDTVAMVRRIRGISINVYDLQVEGCGNFFAEEILVHNSLIIDDPYADQKEAFSETIRKSLEEFWEFTVESRIGAHSNVFGMFHRYHVQDLAGYLLNKGTFEYWRYCSEFDGPYIHDETGQKFDDPLGREIGQLISPDRRPASYYETKRREPRVWNSMFQGRPSSEQGDFFNIGRIKPVSPDVALQRRESCSHLMRAWDNAATDDGGDWTAGVLLGIRPDGRVTIFHAEMVQEASEQRLATQKRIAAIDGFDVPIGIPQDPGSAGKDVVFYTQREMSGYTVVARSTSGSKEERARSFADAVNSGMVEIVEGDWNKQFLRALRDFPLSDFDDPVDAASDAYSHLYSMYRRGLVIKNFRPWNLLSWIDFSHRFGNCRKVPANFNVFASAKITPDASQANSAAIVVRAPDNARMGDTLFVVAAYKAWTDDYNELFDWLDAALAAFCENTDDAIIWLHPDSEEYQQVLLQKLGRMVAMFDGDASAGIAELDWYLKARPGTVNPFDPEMPGVGMYALITDLAQMAAATDELGMYSLRQEARTWSFTDKGEPNAIGGVMDCLRMITARFRTAAQPLTVVEKIEASLDENLRLETLDEMPNSPTKDSLIQRRNLELRKAQADIGGPVRPPHVSRFSRR